MAPDLVTESYNRGYNEARALYEDEKLEEAIATAEAMLEDSGLPRYHRIKCYLLIAACVDDWQEADELILQSEALWQMARGLVSERAHDEVAEHGLAELRDGIDSLKRQHEAERPDEGFDGEADVQDDVEMAATLLRNQEEEEGNDEDEDEEMEQAPTGTGEGGAEPLYHHRHRAKPKGGTMRGKPKPANQSSSSRPGGSPATLLPFRDPTLKKE